MERRINWLHITDLHYGQRGQNILLPKIKKELFKDIEYIKEQIGKIDIVFFTGDLTQSGKKEEFDELTVFLNELWSHFHKLNSNPYLIAIPGNHDVERPDLSRAAVKVLRNYHNDPEFQDDLWNGLAEKSEYHEVISKCFANFTSWYREISLPKPILKEGLIPGDISARVLINNITLNIIGLNTAFLEISNDDYLGKLAIHPSQFITLVGKNPLEWVEEGDLSLLLTHHDPKWYDSRSVEYYNNDINPSGSFYSHLCGHLHEANTFEYGLVGSGLRRTQLAPSLFGLQKINNNIDRIHGYYAGSYFIQANTLIEQFYPRRANKRYDGNYGIDADTGYHLGKLGFLEFTHATGESDNTIHINPDTITATDLSVTEDATKTTTPFVEENILDLKGAKGTLKELEKVPKISYSPLPQHLGIRIVEQRNFAALMERERIVWLITDWGLDETGFIGSVSENLRLENSRSSFILNCEDIVNDTELIAGFNEQFGMTLQRFCNLSATLKNTLLVLDHVNINLYNKANAYHRFSEILKSILDYCPKMHIVVLARQIPNVLSIQHYIRLAPLDAAQIKSYVELHSGNTQELDDPDNLLKLIEITSGLPKHIDRVIETLKITTFEEFVEAERETPPEEISPDEIPKSLRQAIGILSDTTDRFKLRSFKLLKILTILANGETFSNLSRFDASQPIYPDNANELEQLSLLEVITTSKVLTKVAGNPTQQIKILRIPRQIRDYVNTLITENEKDDIIRFACDMYFGSKWREGNIKEAFGTSVFGTNKFFNVDNCHLIISSLMASAIKNNSEIGIDRASLVAINFCDNVFDVGDYKNTIHTAEEIYNWLKSTDHNRSKAHIAKILGEALRMLGSHDKSNLMLNEALNLEGGQLSNQQKNRIYIDLGFTYIQQSKFDKAIECAKAIEKTATPKHAQSIQARYILAQATLKDYDLLKKIKSLESDAKRANLTTLVNTLSIHIADLSEDSVESEKRYDKILTTTGDDYNKIRAIIRKSTETLKYSETTLPLSDLHLLNMSYSYLYAQRLEVLFTSCHKALWLYCIKENRQQDLLNLFKHSSLVWRISGENELEKSYFEKLEIAVGDSINQIERDAVNNANIDYYNRRKLEFNDQKLLI